MKKFMNLKVKSWELVVICIILACVVLRPDWLVQLNMSLLGKGLLVVALVAASLHKPYMGLLVLLLIVSLGYYREGLVLDNKTHVMDNHHGVGDPKHSNPPACNTYTDPGDCDKHKASCIWTPHEKEQKKGSCGKRI